MILGDSERGLWFLQDQAPTVWGLSQCQAPAVLVASPVPGSCPVHRLGAPNDQKLSLDPLQAASEQNIVGEHCWTRHLPMNGFPTITLLVASQQVPETRHFNIQ